MFHLLTYFLTVLRDVRDISAIARKPTRLVYKRIARSLFIFRGLPGMISLVLVCFCFKLTKSDSF